MEGDPHRRWLRRLLAAGSALTLGAGLLLVAAWLGQDRLIYFPDRSDPGPAAPAVDGGEDVALHTADGLELTAWFVPPTAGAPERDTAVLLAPGNGGNRLGRADLAADLADHGLAVLLLEYRGYGGNPGSPSADGLHADARAALEALEDRGYPPERTVYLGESLGTAVVARLNSEVPAAGLVLRSPFTSIADVGAHHYPVLPIDTLLRDRYEVREHVATTQVPVTVVQGDADSVVPPGQSRAVADAAPRLAEHLVLPGADHNDPVMFGPEVADAVARLVERTVDDR
ncbi:alpha/beta hydrolase [Isoptericola croceus]|uniref:alpha/beta hydrolase n=1 Tax=Isoptericola croceus TaxID=3031406 RepID=UPI0023F95803|nr:alpha/beta hydrolase [Isoptericola croceus]